MSLSDFTMVLRLRIRADAGSQEILGAGLRWALLGCKRDVFINLEMQRSRVVALGRRARGSGRG